MGSWPPILWTLFESSPRAARAVRPSPRPGEMPTPNRDPSGAATKSALLELYSLALVWFSRASRASALRSQAPQELGRRRAAAGSPLGRPASSQLRKTGPGTHSPCRSDRPLCPHTGPWPMRPAGTPSPLQARETSPLSKCCPALDLDTLTTRCGEDHVLLQMGRRRSRWSHTPGPEPEAVAGWSYGTRGIPWGRGVPLRRGS